MAYTKPEVLAQTSAQGSFAAGCSAKTASNSDNVCKQCERIR